MKLITCDVAFSEFGAVLSCAAYDSNFGNARLDHRDYGLAASEGPPLLPLSRIRDKGERQFRADEMGQQRRIKLRSATSGRPPIASVRRWDAIDRRPQAAKNKKEWNLR